MIKLDKQVTVFVPEKDNEGNKLDFTEQINGIIATVGGETVTPAQGYWVSNTDGSLMVDLMNLVSFNYQAESGKDSHMNDRIKEFIQAILAIGKQEGVSVKIDGTLYIVSNVGDVEELADLLN